MPVNLSHNGTSLEVHLDGFAWNFTPISHLVVGLLGAVLNAAVLTHFILTGLIHSSPFMVYCVNLLVANLLHCLVLKTIIVFLTTYSHTSWIACYLYFYSLYTTDAAIISSHFLLALNRFWAVTFPASYRHAHTRSRAIFASLLMWTYIQAFAITRVSLLRFTFSEISYGTCQQSEVGQQKFFVSVLRGLLMTVPYAGVLLLFPVIWSNLSRLRKVRGARDRTSTAGEKSSAVPSLPRNPRASDRSATASTGFKVLCALTISLFIFWTPVIIGYNALYFPVTGLLVAGTLRSCETIVDPVLLALTLSTVQISRKTWFRKYRHGIQT